MKEKVKRILVVKDNKKELCIIPQDVYDKYLVWRDHWGSKGYKHKSTDILFFLRNTIYVGNRMFIEEVDNIENIKCDYTVIDK